MKNAREVADWLDETIKHLGPLSGAANLAGVLLINKQIVDTEDEDWDSIMDVNLRGVFNCVRAELQRMDKDASIVSASSVAGLKGKAIVFRDFPFPLSGVARHAVGTKFILLPCLISQPVLIFKSLHTSRNADFEIVLGYGGGAAYSTSKVHNQWLLAPFRT